MIVFDLVASVVFVLVPSFAIAFVLAVVRRHSQLTVHIPQSSEDTLFVKSAQNRKEKKEGKKKPKERREGNWPEGHGGSRIEARRPREALISLSSLV